MKVLLTALWRDESGQDSAEFALLLLMIALALIVTVQAFRTAISDAFSRASGQMDAGA